MSQETKERVFAKLQAFIKGSDYLHLQKSKPKIAEQIKNIKADDLTFGETSTAKFFRGYFTGNARAKGFMSGHNEYERTINFDYTTKTIGFIDDDNTANDDELYWAAQVLGMHIYDLGVAKYSRLGQLGTEIYRQSESTLAQIRNVLPFCRREFEKLDYILRPDSITILDSEYHQDGAAEMLIFPVYANIIKSNGKESKIFLGYFIEYDEEYFFTINANDLIKKPKSRIWKDPDKKVSVGKIIKWVLIGAVIVGIAAYIIQFTIALR